MASINNAWACRAWLNYLEQGPAGALIGKVNNDILSVAAKYSIFNTYMDYYAEVPLLGEAGVDLSAQYCMEDFLEGNLLQYTPMAPFGKILHQYAGLLHSLAPQEMSRCNCFLETDTASGDKEQAALFLNMLGNDIDQLVAEALVWNDMEDRREIVEKYLHLLQPEIYLWQLGFMFSRKETPIRLVLTFDEAEAENFLQALYKLGKPAQAKLVEPLLRELDRLKLFSFLLDIDIQQNGALGDTIGLELVPNAVTPTQQLMMFRTPEWQKASELLHEMARVDERLELLPAALISGVAPDKRQEPYYMYSTISHIKLRWRKEEQLPSKAYLRLKNKLLQKAINDLIF